MTPESEGRGWSGTVRKEVYPVVCEDCGNLHGETGASKLEECAVCESESLHGVESFLP